MLILCCFLLSLIPFPVADLPILSFYELQKIKEEENGKEIAIRGFLYPTSDYGGVLSAEPNLKSCCVGSIAKSKTQIFLPGPLPAPVLSKKGGDTIVMLKGKLWIMPSLDLNNDTHTYFLTEVEEFIPSYGRNLQAVLFLMLLGSFFLIFFRLKNKSYKQREVKT